MQLMLVYAERPGPNVKGALYKTRPCFEFRDTGKCKLGDRCNYAHGDAELRPDRGVRRDPPVAEEESPALYFVLLPYALVQLTVFRLSAV